MLRLFDRFFVVALIACLALLGTSGAAFSKDEYRDRDDGHSSNHGGNSSNHSGSSSDKDDDDDDDDDSDKGSGDKGSGGRGDTSGRSTKVDESSAAKVTVGSNSSASNSSPASLGSNTGPNLNQNDARDAVRLGRVRKLKDVISVVNNTAPGSIISVKLRDGGNNLIYDIKVLTSNQRVKTVSVNASTLSIY